MLSERCLKPPEQHYLINMAMSLKILVAFVNPLPLVVRCILKEELFRRHFKDYSHNPFQVLQAYSICTRTVVFPEDVALSIVANTYRQNVPEVSSALGMFVYFSEDLTF